MKPPMARRFQRFSGPGLAGRYRGALLSAIPLGVQRTVCVAYRVDDCGGGYLSAVPAQSQ